MEEKERNKLIKNRKIHFNRWIIIAITYIILDLHFTLADALQAPRFITQPSSSSNIVSEGRTKILQCQATGYPQPTYKWIKDGEDLGEFSSEHFYRILNTRREDAGSYQCVAKK